MIELARRLVMGAGLACLAGAGLGCPSSHKPPVVVPTPPPPPPVDPNALPEKGKPVALNLLLRPAPGGRFQFADGRPFQWFQAIQCCGGAGAVLGDTANTRWPLASEGWMDYASSMGANAFHFRLGPFHGTPDAESEWADIGGPIVNGAFNEAFWAKARALAWHAARLNAIVEVVTIDTWYCKHAASSWGDQQMPWPQADIDACGVTMTPTQEAFIRKAVDELGGFGNVIWSVDNEGGLVRGAKREWFEASQRIIRDEEQRGGAGIVHMVGTNWPDIADGPWDYIATHDRAPLTQPIGGRPSINNERNPSLGPDQEASYFAQAREKGLGWSLWLADLTGDKVKRIFELFRDVAKGSAAVGCFPAPEDDPRWVGVPTRAVPDAILAALEQAKREVGDPQPSWQACVRGGETPIACMFPTLDALSDSMRRQGFCAGRTRDAITAKADDGSQFWFELHATAATNGGYSGAAYKGSTWTLK